jgi:hypothetical protein
VHLAFYFGVSYESALWRLKTLKLVSEEERVSLAGQTQSANEFRKLLWNQNGRSRRVLNREGKFQHKLLMLGLEAFRLGEISLAKLDRRMHSHQFVPRQSPRSALGAAALYFLRPSRSVTGVRPQSAGWPLPSRDVFKFNDVLSNISLNWRAPTVESVGIAHPEVIEDLGFLFSSIPHGNVTTL